MSNGATLSTPNPALEAYKLEYQLAADRYENIYKALWQIFSYLSAVTGALLAFGGDRFHPNLVWVLASLPLFFWYVSTFLPMNTYGDLCLNRLVGIEADINKETSATIKHYTDFKADRLKGFRVRHTVHILGLMLGLVLVINGYKSIRAWCDGIPLIREKPPEAKLISLTVGDLRKLMQQPTTQEGDPTKSTIQH